MEKIMNIPEKPHQRCLADVELDAVSGGEGNLAYACIRGATQYLQDHTFKTSRFGWDLARELSCPPSGL
jgi:hypothetical protein